jgi:hypothetical protein
MRDAVLAGATAVYRWICEGGRHRRGFHGSFPANFKIQIVEEAEDGMTIVFDMVGVRAEPLNECWRSPGAALHLRVASSYPVSKQAAGAVDA